MSYYYGHQSNPNVAAAQKYQVPEVNVQIPASSIVREAPKWSWCSTVWSAISLLCCASLCGFIGMLCAIHSYVDHKSGDYERSSRKRKCAWGWSMTGIALGVLGIIAIIVVFVVFYGQLRHYLDNYNGTDINNQY